MAAEGDVEAPAQAAESAGDPKLPPGMNKKIIQEGSGDERPEDGSEVSVHYVGTLEDGKQFDSSYDRNSPFNFTLGSGSVIPGWEKAVPTMKRNEIAEFSIPSELAYGERGSPPTIPPNARLIFKIELLDWVEDAGDDSNFKLSTKDRISKCKERKDAGGDHFKAGDFNKAIREYREIMKLAGVSELRDDGRLVELDSCQNSSLPAESDEDKAARDELKQMLVAGYLNLALCYLKLTKVKECMANCDQALAIDSKNIKANFRKGLAFKMTNDFEDAIKQFDLVLEVDPANVEAKNKKAECQAALKDYYNKQKNLFQKMFAI